MPLQSFTQSDAEAFNQSKNQARDTLGPASLWAVNLDTSKIDWIWDSGDDLNGVAIVGDDLWVVGVGSSSYDGATTGLGQGVAWKFTGLSNTVELSLSQSDLGTTNGSDQGLAITGDGGKGVDYSTDVFMTLNNGIFSDFNVRVDPSTGAVIDTSIRGLGLLLPHYMGITSINDDLTHFGPGTAFGQGYGIRGNVFSTSAVWHYNNSGLIDDSVSMNVTNDGTNIWVCFSLSTGRPAHSPLSSVTGATLQQWESTSTGANGQILYQAALTSVGTYGSRAITASTSAIFVATDTSTGISSGSGKIQKLSVVGTTGQGSTSDIDWTYDTDSSMTAIALTTDGNIVSGSNTGRILKLTDDTTPTLDWERFLPDSSTGSGVVVADVCTRGNYAYFATERYTP